jgi:hypothetical protein
MKRHKKNSTNITKRSKYKSTYYQNTHTYTQPHTTKQVKRTTIQDTQQVKYVCVIPLFHAVRTVVVHIVLRNETKCIL